jgi:hypothetical protein
MGDLIDLINDYISCSNYMCNSLRDDYCFTEESLLGAWRKSKTVPKEGNLSDGTYFNFHGSGVYFEFENGEIDIDFGPNGRCDGFDLGRLKHFLLSTKRASYTNLTDEGKFAMEFERLTNCGIIFNPQWIPSPHLYFLKR